MVDFSYFSRFKVSWQLVDSTTKENASSLLPPSPLSTADVLPPTCATCQNLSPACDDGLLGHNNWLHLN